VKFDFYHSKLRKQPYFAENFKIQEERDTPCPIPHVLREESGDKSQLSAIMV